MSSTDVADKLIQAHDGDMTLLYIWIKRRNSHDLNAAAKDLCMTMQRVNEAFEKLSICGILPGKKPEKPVPQPAEEAPQVTADDLRHAAEDRGFRAVLDYAEQAFGRVLTKDDMGKLLNIYNGLGLGADVIFVLINHCRHITDRRLTMHFVQTKAYEWVNRGITDVEQAEEFAEHAMRMKERESQILKILGIHDRVPSNITAIIDSWIDKNCSDDLIEQAYGITFEKTGKLAWKYMNTVLEGLLADSRESETPGSTSALPDTIRKNGK